MCGCRSNFCPHYAQNADRELCVVVGHKCNADMQCQNLISNCVCGGVIYIWHIRVLQLLIPLLEILLVQVCFSELNVALDYFTVCRNKCTLLYLDSPTR